MGSESSPVSLMRDSNREEGAFIHRAHHGFEQAYLRTMHRAEDDRPPLPAIAPDHVPVCRAATQRLAELSRHVLGPIGNDEGCTDRAGTLQNLIRGQTIHK